MALAVPTPLPSDSQARRRLLRNAAWAAVGTATYGASQWAAVILLARLGTPQAVGQFSIGLATVSPIVLLAICGQRTLLATDCGSRFRFADYVRLWVVTAAAALAAAAGLAAFSGLEGSARGVFVALAAARSFEALSDLCYGALQLHERLDAAGRSLAAKAIVSALAITGAVAFRPSAVAAAAALAGVSALWAVAYDLPSAARLVPASGKTATAHRPRGSTRNAVRALWLASLPIGVTAMLGTVLANVPRYALEGMRSDAELGVFSAIATFAVAAQVLVNPLAQAVLPRLARRFAAGELTAFRGTVIRLVIVGIALAAVLVVASVAAGRSVILLLLGEGYAAHAGSLTVLAASLLFAFPVCFLDHALYASRFLRVQIPINLCSLAASAAIAGLLVPRFGVAGAAWTVCLTAALQFALRAALACYLFRPAFDPAATRHDRLLHGAPAVESVG